MVLVVLNGVVVNMEWISAKCRNPGQPTTRLSRDEPMAATSDMSEVFQDILNSPGRPVQRSPRTGQISCSRHVKGCKGICESWIFIENIPSRLYLAARGELHFQAFQPEPTFTTSGSLAAFRRRGSAQDYMGLASGLCEVHQ